MSREAPPQDDDPLADAPGAEQTCDDGLDDNGDGVVDEGCGCLPGTVQPCYPAAQFPGVGRCRRGIQHCDDAVPEFPTWGTCENAVLPVDEVCQNDIDEDCDGEDGLCELLDDDGDGLGGDDGDDDGDGDGEDRDDDGDDGDDDDGGQIPAVPFEQVFDYGDDPVARPVDFVWAVDQSDSMGDEIALVRSRINDFAADLADSGLDYRVVMVADRSDDRDHHDLCVPEPLAGPGCADSERFQQLDVHVDSDDALQLIAALIDPIEAFMRPGSLRVVVVVSDDDSDLDGGDFDAFLRGREGYDDWVFNGFVGLDDDVCDDIEDEGAEYASLAAMTGGVVEHICLDWAVGLEAFSTEALRRAASFVLDPAPDAATLEVSMEHAGGDWEPLDAASWALEPPDTIVLAEDVGLEAGDRVRVRYQPLVL